MPSQLPDELVQRMARLRSDVERALDQATTFGPLCPATLQAAMRHILLAPAKRLRPILVLLATEACGGDPASAMPAAVAVELVHTYSLVHDDLPAMDNDDLRRGVSSCHILFGEATAILAGDALLARAFEVLATLQPASLVGPCCAELAWTAGAEMLVGGQFDDLDAEQQAGSRELLEAIHLRKTAAMFRASMRLGGLIAQANSTQLEGLTQFGRNLGLAFQIVDDLLDVSGEQNAMGKRTGKDLELGKLTFPSLVGIEHSRQQAERLIQQACQAIEGLPQARDLTAIARFVIERDR